MKHHPDRPNGARRRAGSVRGGRSARAFTLTELIVAIGAVALLAVGIGQIFQAVGKLTSLGQAASETDQLARMIERRLRADFDALNRMPEDRAFIAIRMRELGDINRDRQASEDPSEGEAAIYLTAADEESDRRDSLSAYRVISTPSGDVTAQSRAVTVRADEIVFIGLAAASEPFASSEPDPRGTAPGPAAASAARIYWGHALRPRFDTEYDPDDPMDRPLRQYVADGDLGQPRWSDAVDQYVTPDGLTTLLDSGPAATRISGRNKYAGSFLLARQAMVLFGGTAIGQLDPAAPEPLSSPPPYAPLPSPIGNDREYAPYVRDLEATDFIGRWALPTNPGRTDGVLLDTFDADPRLMMWGRSDICAQSASDAQRWLEGEASDPSATTPPPFAGAYAEGYYSKPPLFFADIEAPNKPLWKRVKPGDPGIGNDTDLVMQINQANLRAAIAGTFTRLLADDRPPRIWRDPPTDPAADRQQSDDALMDVHAAIASRCSNFEIAWSDGTRVLRDLDVDNAPGNRPEYRPGDMLWYDITPVIDPGSQTLVLRRNTQQDWVDAFLGGGQFAGQAIQSIEGPLLDVVLSGYDLERSPPVEILGGRYALDLGLSATAQFDLLMNGNHNSQASGGADYTDAGLAMYDAFTTGGERHLHEALTIWPYRLPAKDGGYGLAWPKPKFIRVRMTLHDAQFRIPNGRTYEFVFPIDLAPAAGS